MKELVKQVEILSKWELENANKKFSGFNSTHEGYAIILEEVEEVEDELKNVKVELEMLWKNVKNNSGRITSHAFEMKKYAINLAAESIQVAAMAQKFINSIKNE